MEMVHIKFIAFDLQVTYFRCISWIVYPAVLFSEIIFFIDLNVSVEKWSFQSTL